MTKCLLGGGKKDLSEMVESPLLREIRKLVENAQPNSNAQADKQFNWESLNKQTNAQTNEFLL